MIKKSQYKEALKIIEQYEKEQKELSVKRNSNPDCALNRLPKNCSIILHTSATSCKGCGHNLLERHFYKRKENKKK